MVLNKIDRLTETEIQQKLEALKEKTKNSILLSALKQLNLDQLKKEILKKLEGYIQACFTVPLKSETMTLISLVHDKADVKKTNYTQNGLEVIFEADPEFAEKTRKRVQELGGAFECDQIP